MIKYLSLIVISATTLQASDGQTPPRRPSNPNLSTANEKDRELFETLERHEQEVLTRWLKLLAQPQKELEQIGPEQIQKLINIPKKENQ